MPILVVIILFACAIGIVLALITLSLQRISGRVVEQYRQRLDDANTIMNQGSPPDSWVEQFRLQIEESRSGTARTSESKIFSLGGGREASAEEIGEKARKRCLKRLRMLTSFMEKGNFYDEDRTKDMVVTSLRSMYEKWGSCPWEDLVLKDDVETSD